jgi:hypothetical protein
VGADLLMVCVECREELALGDVWLDNDRGGLWRIDFAPEERGIDLEYFLLAHRGHVLGMIDSETSEIQAETRPLKTVWTLDELRTLHPMSDFDDAERLATASPLLESLLDSPAPD